MNTNSYLRIENGYDISKITGVIPQNIGEGFQFDLSDKTYTTMGSYTKDKKRLMNIEISSFCGLCGGAIHYYAKLYIKVSNVCGNSSVSGYLGGIEIPNEYQTIKGEFVRFPDTAEVIWSEGKCAFMVVSENKHSYLLHYVIKICRIERIGNKFDKKK